MKMYGNIIAHKEVEDIIAKTAGGKARESARLRLIFKCFDTYQMFRKGDKAAAPTMETLIRDMRELTPAVLKAHLGLGFTFRWLKAVVWK